MRYLLAFVSAADDTEPIKSLHRELQQTEVDPVQTIVFATGVDQRQLLTQLGLRALKVMPLDGLKSWPAYLCYFDRFFTERFAVMFDQPVSLLVSKGTGAGPAALLLKALEYFGEAVDPTYLYQGQFTRLDVEKVAPKQDLKQLLIYFLNANDYRAALQIIEQDDFLKHSKDSVYAVALRDGIQAMLHRLNNAYPQAEAYWSKTRLLWEDDLAFYEKTLKCLQAIKSESQQGHLAKIQELYRQLLLRLRREDTSGFLTRLYRLRELLVLYVWQYGQESAEPLNCRQPAYEQIDELRTRIAEGKLTGFNSIYFFLKNGYLAETLALRNRAFIGHGRRGFAPRDWIGAYLGRASFNTAVALEDFQQELGIVLRDLGLEPDEDYHVISRQLVRMAKHYL